MPAPGSSARRYAQAVFEIAQERGRLEQWLEELQAIAQVAAEPQLTALLRSPRMPQAAKRQVLRETLAGASEEAVNLATLLAVKGRLEALARPIAQEYERRLDELRGIVRVEVVTAIELDLTEREEVERRLAQATGKQIRMEHRVEPGIVAGMTVRIGDRVVDGSVRSTLRSLRRSLIGGLV